MCFRLAQVSANSLPLGAHSYVITNVSTLSVVSQYIYLPPENLSGTSAALVPTILGLLVYFTFREC